MHPEVREHLFCYPEETSMTDLPLPCRMQHAPHWRSSISIGLGLKLSRLAVGVSEIDFNVSAWLRFFSCITDCCHLLEASWARWTIGLFQPGHFYFCQFPNTLILNSAIHPSDRIRGTDDMIVLPFACMQLCSGAIYYWSSSEESKADYFHLSRKNLI